ncbi:MAG: glycosyltransferase [Saprospiraceae bacterium]|nr:glycosyltransferase [Saprospiraceae bacterium]
MFYAWILKWFARNKQANHLQYTLGNPEELPHITIIMAVYNEEKVLEEKISSIFNTNYPLDKLECLIGSDSSTDQTHQILQEAQQKYPQLEYEVFSRRGKPNILNSLQPKAKGEIYIFTDANVFFEPNTLYELVKHFKNEQISQVGANFLDKSLREKGIALQEKSYIQRETLIKYNEGLIWGTMMGVFGGAYALRASSFVPNPPNFIVEDFYISMKVLGSGQQAILEPKAIVYEDVSTNIREEFRRKIRISAGNFQNLKVFYPLLSPPFTGLAFCFLSHKILRWLGPFFILIALVASGVLAWGMTNIMYLILFLLQIFGLLGIPLLDYILQKMQINISLIRYVAYFNAMNLALLAGFFKYLKGVKTNVWQPTKRNT